MAALAGHLGLQCADWLGHSLGGHIVLQLGLAYPELIRRLVALCPAGGQPERSWLQEGLYHTLSRGDGLRWYHPRLLALAVAYIFNQPLVAPPFWPGFPEFAARLNTQWSGPNRPLRERALVRACQGVLNHTLAGRLAGLQAPVLLLEGLGDHITPANQTQRLWESLPPGQQRARLPGGHMVPYLVPRELAQAVASFLEPHP